MECAGISVYWRDGVSMEEFWKAARKRENVRYEQAASFSPYSEFSGNWKEEKGDITSLSFNGFYRYEPIMRQLFTDDFKDDFIKNWFFDIYVHYLVELEYLSGATYGEFQVQGIMRQIAMGEYGERIQRTYKTLSEEKQYFVANMLVNQHKTGASVEKYSKALVEVMSYGIVYKDKYNEKQLLFYVGQKESEEDRNRIEMITELFCPLGYQLRVFWDRHFAVLEQSQTMQMGEIELL